MSEGARKVVYSTPQTSKHSGNGCIDMNFSKSFTPKVPRQLKCFARSIRQHVNPLSKKFQTPEKPPVWDEVFANPHQPLHVDVGSAKGRWLLHLARNHKDRNHIGLEIRERLVSRAKYWARTGLHQDDKPKFHRPLQNCDFIFCNANISFHPILSTYPGAVKYISVNNPDPHFKQKHRKRRVMNTSFVNILGSIHADGGILYVQSDVREVCDDMIGTIESTPLYDRIGANDRFEDEAYLPRNYFGEETEREKSVLTKAKDNEDGSSPAMWRMAFVRRYRKQCHM